MRPKILGTEQRQVVVDDFETRAANADGSIPFRGHAAVFNRFTLIAGVFRERIMPGAFRKTIGEADVRFLHNHNPQMVMARTKAGTLRLSEDARGLLVEADMAPVSYVQDLAVSLQRGDVSEMSFGFRAVKEDWNEVPKIPERTVTEAQLYDVSTVTFPAYQGTDASLRMALYDMLGIAELDDEQRAALIAQVQAGDVAPDMLPVLRAAQERFASLVPSEPSNDTHAGGDAEPPNGTRAAGSPEQLRIRMRMRELSQTLS